MERLYENIKNRRLELDMSQEELALKMGYKDRSTIAKIETGKVDLSISKIVEIAKALNTSPIILLGWDTAENLTPQEKVFLFYALQLKDRDIEQATEYLEFLANKKRK